MNNRALTHACTHTHTHRPSLFESPCTVLKSTLSLSKHSRSLAHTLSHTHYCAAPASHPPPHPPTPTQILQRSADDREVIIFDHMRMGASANDTGRGNAPLTIPLMAKSTADLIRALKVRTAGPDPLFKARVQQEQQGDQGGSLGRWLGSWQSLRAAPCLRMWGTSLRIVLCPLASPVLRDNRLPPSCMQSTRAHNTLVIYHPSPTDRHP
jgi:hypothetical protein